MLITPPLAAAVGVALAFSPLAHRLGFARLPLAFFFILLGMIAAYLVLIELAKARFYRAERHPHRTRPTREQRHERHQRRRLARFMHHEGPRLPIGPGTLGRDQ
jgi:Mg2+-importing ATPase